MRVVIEAIGITPIEIHIQPQSITFGISQDLKLKHIAPGWVFRCVTKDDFEVISAHSFNYSAFGAERTIESEIAG